MKVKYSAATHLGLKRKKQEDAYKINEALGLFVVADGLGGHGHGEVASQIAVDAVEQYLQKHRPYSYEQISASLCFAHEQIAEVAKNELEKRNMATTAVMVVMVDHAFHLAWVGDSRAYRLDRNGHCEQITTDHSLAQEMIANGLSPSKAYSMPIGHVLSQSLGGGATPEPQVLKGDLLPGERLLLCTDGLSNELTEAVIEQICLGKPKQPITKVADDLVNTVLKRGMKGAADNITVVVIEAVS